MPQYVIWKERQEGMTLGGGNERDLGRIEGEELGVDIIKTLYGILQEHIKINK